MSLKSQKVENTEDNENIIQKATRTDKMDSNMPTIIYTVHASPSNYININHVFKIFHCNTCTYTVWWNVLAIMVLED